MLLLAPEINMPIMTSLSLLGSKPMLLANVQQIKLNKSLKMKAMAWSRSSVKSQVRVAWFLTLGLSSGDDQVSTDSSKHLAPRVLIPRLHSESLNLS